MEAIKVEKDLVAISHHPGNEESEASTLEKNEKKKETKLDGKDRVIFQLKNEIMNLKRSKGEGKKPVKRKTNTNTSLQIPPTSGID